MKVPYFLPALGTMRLALYVNALLESWTCCMIRAWTVCRDGRSVQFQKEGQCGSDKKPAFCCLASRDRLKGFQKD